MPKKSKTAEIETPDYPIVLVEWADSYSLSAGWKSLDDILADADDLPYICSVGFMVHDGVTAVTLVPHTGAGSGSGEVVIPKSAIRSMIEL